MGAQDPDARARHGRAMSTLITTSAQGDPLATDRPAPRVAYGGAAGLAILVGCVAVGGAFDAGYSPRREAMSALGATDAEHPLTFTVGVVALALGALTMAFTVGRRLPGKAARATSVLLVLAGLGMAVDGFARQDCSTYLDPCAALEKADAVSGAHAIHELAGLLGFVCVVAAAFALARALRTSDGLAPLAGPTKAVGFVLVALLVFVMVYPVPAVGGLVQRVFVTVAFGWPAYVAIVASRRVESGRELSADANTGERVATSPPG